MLQQLKIDIKLNWKDILTLLAVELGLWLLGVILVNLVTRLDETTTNWFCMGSLISLIGLGFFMLFGYGFTYPSQLQLALSMGRTRGAYMFSYAARMLLQTVLGYAFILLLHQGEQALYTVLFPQHGNEVVFTFLTNWKLLVPIALGVMIVAMFLGSIYGYFGKKGMWVFFVLWMLFCFIGPRFADLEEGSTNVLDQAAFGMIRVFRAIPATVWTVFGLVAAAAMIGSTVYMGKRQMVK